MPEDTMEITASSLNSLMESSQKLHAALVNSVAWSIIKDDPVIKNWILSLNDVESQIKAKQAPPDSGALYGSKG